jgi:hypothetical protein
MVEGSMLNILAIKVHLVAFSDEEGLRFQSTFLGSRALAGTFPRLSAESLWLCLLVFCPHW